MLAVAYSQTPQRRAINTLIIGHFDAHGVAYSAARAKVLENRGEIVEVMSQFPETGPRGLSSGQLRQLVESAGVAPQRIEIIDIPIDVGNPDASVLTLQQLSRLAPVYYYDHHETDMPFLPRLLATGITPIIAETNLALMMSLELNNDSAAREIAIIGIVADRDKSVVRLIERQEIEQKYLPLANRLDMVVRTPSIVGVQTQGEVAKLLAREGVALLERVSVEYPPEKLAEQSYIDEEGEIALLINWNVMNPQESMWAPKTLEQLLLLRRRQIAVAVVPAFDQRRNVIGYDVRLLRYWLADSAPTPEEVVRDLIQAKAITGQVVGHSDYVSLRYGSYDEAMRVARVIYRRIEGQVSAVTHLVSDRYVADAVRRDYENILRKLTEILEAQQKMYEEYLSLKREQVELLKRLQGRNDRGISGD